MALRGNALSAPMALTDYNAGMNQWDLLKICNFSRIPLPEISSAIWFLVFAADSVVDYSVHLLGIFSFETRLEKLKHPQQTSWFSGELFEPSTLRENCALCTSVVTRIAFGNQRSAERRHCL